MAQSDTFGADISQVSCIPVHVGPLATVGSCAVILPVNMCVFVRLYVAWTVLFFLSVKHTGNVPLDQIIEIARIMRPRSMARHMSGTVKEILGTAQSIGCTVEGSDAHDVIEQINEGEITIPVS